MYTYILDLQYTYRNIEFEGPSYFNRIIIDFEGPSYFNRI